MLYLRFAGVEGGFRCAAGEASGLSCAFLTFREKRVSALDALRPLNRGPGYGKLTEGHCDRLCLAPFSQGRTVGRGRAVAAFRHCDSLLPRRLRAPFPYFPEHDRALTPERVGSLNLVLPRPWHATKHGDRPQLAQAFRRPVRPRHRVVALVRLERQLLLGLELVLL